eukprot:3947920-Alexandrium_andersonii.AAC.1
MALPAGTPHAIISEAAANSRRSASHTELGELPEGGRRDGPGAMPRGPTERDQQVAPLAADSRT